MVLGALGSGRGDSTYVTHKDLFPLGGDPNERMSQLMQLWAF